MIKNTYNSYSFSFRSFSLVFFTSLFYVTSYSTLANNIAINHSQLEQYITLSDEEVLLKPAGEGVFLSLDLNDNWSVKFDYQNWQDNEQAVSPVLLDLTLTSLGGSINYMQNNWYVSTSIDLSEDDISYGATQRRSDFHQDNTQVTSFSGILGYNWLQENWMFNASIGAQYANWSIENKVFNRENAQHKGKPSEETTITEDNTSTINARISAARYWALTQQQGILAGLMFSWNYQLSGDENLTEENILPPIRQNRPQPTTLRNSGSNTSRATSGDDNYGQITAYLSYDINNTWSVDIDTAVEISSANNNQSWAIGFNYSF